MENILVTRDHSIYLDYKTATYNDPGAHKFEHPQHDAKIQNVIAAVINVGSTFSRHLHWASRAMIGLLVEACAYIAIEISNGMNGLGPFLE
jgi:hypothetical protein